MLKYHLDNITKQDGIDIVYIHIKDGEKVITTDCLPYNNAKEFKKILRNKIIKIKSDYDEKEIKKAEIKQALLELEAE